MFLIGQKIILKKIDETDTDYIIKWRNQYNVKQYFINQDILSKQKHLTWLNDFVKTGKCEQFIIISKDDNSCIGTIYIRDIDYINKKGEFGIYIGEDRYRGLGLGTESATMILKYAFNNLKLNKVFLRVLSNNIPAIKSYQKVGFQQEGYFKKDIVINNSYYDVIFMGILKCEFEKVS